MAGPPLNSPERRHCLAQHMERGGDGRVPRFPSSLGTRFRLPSREETSTDFLLTRDGGGADRMTGSVCPGVGALSRGVPAALNPTSALLPQTDVTASLGSLSSQVQGHGCSVLGHILEKAGLHASPCPSMTDGTGSFVVFPVEKVSLICCVSYPSSSL